MKEIDQDRMVADLRSAGIHLKEDALDRLWSFHCILRERNRRLNLTRLYSYEAMVRKHYVDCLLVTELLSKRGLRLDGPVMDLGSGGGFPGIPLAIESPDTAWYLVEGRKNRCAYLKETVAELGLSNVTVYWRKLQPTDALSVRAVITRAVESMTGTAERVSGSLEKGGLLLFMKGPHCDDEIRKMQGEPYEPVLDEHYTLPGSERDRRRLVVFRRTSEPGGGRRLYPYGETARQWKHALHIMSAENVRYKSLKKIMRGGARSIMKEGQTLVYGRRVVDEVLNETPENVEAMLFDERSFKKGLASNAIDIVREERLPAGIDLLVLSASLIDGLGLKGFEPPYLLYRVNPIPQWDASVLTEPMLFLPLGDPENMGLSLRSALAFGFKKIILLEEAASPYLPAVIRASSGASLRLNYRRGPSVLKLANVLGQMRSGLPGNERGAEPIPPIFYLDRDGQALPEQSRPATAFGLIVGEEGRGIPDSLRRLAEKGAVKALKIPMSDEIESLNAAVSLSIAMYQLRLTR